MSALLPMFPLGSVLLPGDLLPLHVFELRYRALVRACLAAPDPEFGVVLIERGSEVGGGDVRRDVGTLARIVEISEAADGRYGVLAVGTRRMRIEQWLPDDPYPMAEIGPWNEGTDTPGDDEVAELFARVRRAAALAIELGDRPASGNDELSTDAVLAGYQLITMAPLGAADRYELLCAASPAERMRRLADLLADVEAALAFRLGNS